MTTEQFMGAVTKAVGFHAVTRVGALSPQEQLAVLAYCDHHYWNPPKEET